MPLRSRAMAGGVRHSQTDRVRDLLRPDARGYDPLVTGTEPRVGLVRLLLDAEPEADQAEFTRKVMHAFLRMCSETPDNLACATRLEYGTRLPVYDGDRPSSGLKVKGADVLLSDVAWAMEELPVPRERFPELSAEQWSAATRMITVLIAALERREPT